MPVDVAIKVWLHPRDEDEETADNDLMNFYNQMRLQFDNIASIVGMCTDVEPYYIIYEYLDRVSCVEDVCSSVPAHVRVHSNTVHIVISLVCVYWYTYAYKSVCGEYTLVWMYTQCTLVHTQTNAYTHTHTQTNTQTHACTHTHTHTYMHMHPRTYTPHTHACTPHTHAHTHKHWYVHCVLPLMFIGRFEAVFAGVSS